MLDRIQAERRFIGQKLIRLMVSPISGAMVICRMFCATRTASVA